MAQLFIRRAAAPGAFLSCIVFAANLAVAQDHHGPPPTRQISASAWLADIDHLARELPRVHREAFHSVSREEFDRQIAELKSRVPALARHEVIVGISRIIARIGDGHTHIPLQMTGLSWSPVRLYDFADGLHIISGHQDYASLVGGRVISIGGRPAAEVMAAASALVPADKENPFWVRLHAANLLASPEILHALGITKDPATIPIEVAKEGRRITGLLKPGDVSAMWHGTLWLAPEGWVDSSRAAGEGASRWLKDPTNNFWSEYLADSKTLYFQYNAVQHKPDKTVGAFFRELLESDAGKQAERLVIDLRHNGGGNNFLNLPIIHALIRSDRFNQRGRLFAIIGRQTFSAAMNCVNALETHTQVIFVGEPTGGSPNHYGDAARIALPNSGLAVFASTLWWQDVHPADARSSRAPDLAADLTYADYRDGRDQGLDVIARFATSPPAGERIGEAISLGDHVGARRLFAEWKADPVNRYASIEADLNRRGYEFMQAAKHAEAITVFEINAEGYPDSANAWDSLGEAQMAAGDHVRAIVSYEKSLQLNPRNGNAEEILRRLRGGTRHSSPG